MANTPEETKPPTPKFSKEQLLKSTKYHEKRDALSTILDADKQYTHAEVDATLQKFYKGGVK